MKRTQKQVTEHFVRIKKIDEDEQIVFGEVYAPNILDTYGDFMTKEDIRDMSHRFMQLTHMRLSIDTNHDETSNGSYPIESFIARANDPDYTEGAWVLGVKIVDDEVWKEVKKGNLNGYSFQALVNKLAVVVDMDVTYDKVGVTEPGDDNNHSHLFFVELDEDGRVLRGRTSVEDGHFHEIDKGTATEEAKGHSHRIHLT